MKDLIEIMLVEDNSQYREVIEFALEDQQDMTLHSQFATAESALASLQNSRPAQYPDVILLDLQLPGMSGIDALPHFKELAENTYIIMLTQSDLEADVFATLYKGASGYLLKSSRIAEIKQAIRQVMLDEAPIDAKVVKYLLDDVKKRPPKSMNKDMLSPREYEILVLLAKGLQKKEIGDKLHISYPTVSTHVSHLYEKLDVKNAPAAVSTAYELGIIH